LILQHFINFSSRASIINSFVEVLIIKDMEVLSIKDIDDDSSEEDVFFVHSQFYTF